MRLINWILLFPLVLIALSFAVSNRDGVTLTLWPLPFALDVPIVLFSFVILVLGFFFGGLANWLAGQERRKLARDKRKEADRLAREVQSLKSQLEEQQNSVVSVDEDLSALAATNKGAIQDDSKWLPAKKG